MITSVYKKTGSNSQYYVKKANSPSDEVKRVHFLHNIVLNKWNQLAVLLILTALITPIILILTIYSLNIPMSPTNPTDDTCVVNRTYQVQCGPLNITDNDCEAIGCCFINNFCYHRAPSRHGYKGSDGTYLTRRKKTPLDNLSYEELNIAINEISENRLNIQFYNPSKGNIELRDKKLENKSYNYTITENANVIISRDNAMNNSNVIFTTLYGPLVASDNYWEVTISLQSDHLFGFGELYLEPNKTYVFYNNPNELNRLPIVMAYKQYQYHGVYIKSNSLLEVQILESKLMVLRSLTSSFIGFEFDVVLGDTPADVTQIFREMHKSDIPPYWTFGVHVCRDSKNPPNIEKTLKIVKDLNENSKSMDFPYESDCIHENVFSLVMNTTEDETKSIINSVKNDIIKANKRFIMPFTSQIASGSTVYETAMEKNLFYRNPNTCEVIQKNDDEQIISYPNYKHENATKWFSQFIANLPAINYASGLILRNSWPLYKNYSENLTDMQLVYYNKAIEHSFASLLPWNATVQCDNNKTNYHIESHNEYGFNIAQQFESYYDQNLASRDTTRPEFILSASTYYNSNEQKLLFGTINQNLNISWLNLQKQLTNSLFYSIFVHPVLHITPVCGSTQYFNNSLHEELCLRSYFLTATLPMFYISSVEPYRDPFNLPTKFTQQHAITAVKKRYSLLPYFNTVVRQKNVPLVRPMFYNFPYDNKTFQLKTQYMVGDALLSVQVMIPLTQMVPMDIYLPMQQTTTDDNEYGSVWYEFRNGKQFHVPKNNDTVVNGDMTNTGRTIQMPVMSSDWIMFILGGHVIAIHDIMDIKAGNADELRKTTPLTIVVALKCDNSLSTIPDISTESASATSNIGLHTNSIKINNILRKLYNKIPVTIGNRQILAQMDALCYASGHHLIHDDNLTFIKFTSNETHLYIYNINEIKSQVCDIYLDKIIINQIYVYGVDLQQLKIMTKVNINICKLDVESIDVKYEFIDEKLFV